MSVGLNVRLNKISLPNQRFKFLYLAPLLFKHSKANILAVPAFLIAEEDIFGDFADGRHVNHSRKGKIRIDQCSPTNTQLVGLHIAKKAAQSHTTLFYSLN